MTTNTAVDTRPGLAARTLGAAAWSLAAFVASRAITVVSTIVIARLLGPDDFGLFAIVLVVLSMADAATVGSLNDAVQWDRDRRLHERAALGLSVTLGVAVTVVAIVSAPLVARAFGEPRLTLMLVAVAPIPFLAHLYLVNDAGLRARLQYRRRLAPEISRTVVKAAVSIVLAVAGAGVWSLVWGQVAGELVACVLYWWLAPLSSRFPAWDGAVARRLFRFAALAGAAALVAIVAVNIDYVVVGRRLGTAVLGVYLIAYRLPELLVNQPANALRSTLLPAYVEAGSDPDRMRRGFFESVRAGCAVATPIGVVLAVVAEPAVRVVFGSQWLAAATPMRWIALAFAVDALVLGASAALKAAGRPGIVGGLISVKLALLAPLLWWAAGRGISTVGAVVLVVSVVMVVLQAAALRFALGYEIGRVVAAVAPVVASAGVAAGTVALVAAFAPAGLAELGLSVAAGALVYMGVLRLLIPEWLRRIVPLVRRGPGPA